MVKILKPPIIFKGQVILRYLGRNQIFIQKRTLIPISIFDYDHAIGEELVISMSMYDGTEIKISMISANLYIKKNGNYSLMEDQSFCDFEMHISDKMLVFDGQISYENTFSEIFNYKEDFTATIITKAENNLIEIWKKHEKFIIN
ncbi:hypothetical protein IP98_00149 [Flavobacterium cauense R2A-7]|uniref:Uncharacterized protein n=1 Tax=Flavobacterium cauense R2A-7 TaxID=1341154 RepID=A0A562M5M3_9FLAO|nr:hypothetical protein [Flavobacterium cauense]KGO82205.1 hypothetical protein Q762_05825 [Flavobacterium cauense R2A-7]TWI15160.1 hypothetical protein IP98_00149 [Flavobacterium cauense R2A-7]